MEICHECSPNSEMPTPSLLPTTFLLLEMHQSLLPMLQTTTEMLAAAVGTEVTAFVDFFLRNSKFAESAGNSNLFDPDSANLKPNLKSSSNSNFTTSKMGKKLRFRSNSAPKFSREKNFFII
jgi:hypothetical protein